MLWWLHYAALHGICSGMYDRPVQRSGSRSEGREEGYMDIRNGGVMSIWMMVWLDNQGRFD